MAAAAAYIYSGNASQVGDAVNGVAFCTQALQDEIHVSVWLYENLNNLIIE
jgi:hypothetical protein